MLNVEESKKQRRREDRRVNEVAPLVIKVVEQGESVLLAHLPQRLLPCGAKVHSS